jgi:xanthine dehydrogenase accessory factor
MIVLVRGGGDLASGVALRLHRAGLRVVVTELPQPLAVRRLVSFAEAVNRSEISIEGISARKVTDPEDILRVLQILSKGQVPVLVDPEARSAQSVHPTVIVDGRMLKRPLEPLKHNAKLYIGLGPGFTAGVDCSAVIETQRGHRLGRVIWEGAAAADTCLPEDIREHSLERVLRAPVDGVLEAILSRPDLRPHFWS